MTTTSWESVHRWYDDLVGKEGQYYHQHIIIPRVLQLLELQKGDSLLDLGCGQGILARHIPKETAYLGIDLSPALIDAAKKHQKERAFVVGDMTKPLPIKNELFTHVT